MKGVSVCVKLATHQNNMIDEVTALGSTCNGTRWTIGQGGRLSHSVHIRFEDMEAAQKFMAIALSSGFESIIETIDGVYQIDLAAYLGAVVAA